jgi:hypothetical protein
LVPHFPNLALFLPKSGTSTFAISVPPLLKERAGERSSPNPSEPRYFPFTSPIYLVHGSSYLVHNLHTSQPPTSKPSYLLFSLTNDPIDSCLMSYVLCLISHISHLSSPSPTITLSTPASSRQTTPLGCGGSICPKVCFAQRNPSATRCQRFQIREPRPRFP